MAKKHDIQVNKNLLLRILLLAFVLVTIIVFLLYLPEKVGVKAAVVNHGVAADVIPTEIGVKGTESNPFVILEIVPYEGYAEIGYLIDGCEPVDMDRLRYKGEMTTATATSAGTATWGVQYQFDDESGIPKEWTSSNQEKTLYGYYERVADKTGTFIQEIDKNGKIQLKKVGANMGNIVWKTEFGMTADDIDPVESLKKLNNIGDRYYTSRTGSNCRSGYAYAYKNKNYFLKNVLGITDKEAIRNYHVLVKTIEPDDLNKKLGWIDRADLISISPKSHIGGLPKVWESYNRLHKSAQSNSDLNFGTNDISWEAALRIFKKVNVSEDYSGIIFDWTVYTERTGYLSKNVTTYQLDYNGNITNNHNNDQGYNNNIYKLALMSRIMDPKIFYNLFLNDYQGTINPIIQNGLCTKQLTGDAQKYWTRYTFMPSRADGSLAWDEHWNALWDNFKINVNMEGNVSVAGHTYSYNGDCSLSQNFVNETNNGGYIQNSISETKVTKELFDYIRAQGSTNSKLPSDPATAVKYILSMGHGTDNNDIQKDSIKILDIEPTKDFTLTERYIRMMIPRYSGKISIVPMTSAEFIGTIEDLNSTYDMIYMGMNCRGYNLGDNNLTDYNDNNLDGKIYLHVGDKITARSNTNEGTIYAVNWLQGQRTLYTIRMPGNDITKLKSKELEQYIQAGYPILVDSKLYNTGTYDTKKLVDDSSIIYQFVNTQKSKNNLISSTDDKLGLKVQQYIAIQKPQLLLKNKPVEYKGNSTNGLISSDNYINGTNLEDRKLQFNYTIDVTDSNRRYTVKLYIDADADGRYEESELNMSQEHVTPGGDHDLTKPLAKDYFGVIPWKLEIIDESNPCIRDEEIGYSAIKRSDSQKETIRILQINQNNVSNPSNQSTLNLEENVANNGLFVKYIKNLNDYKIIFDTITINEFEKRYDPKNGGKKFDSSSEETKMNTDQLLNNYEMLIFGFSDYYNNISKENGALDNVRYYIENLKSVLFTHDVTSFHNVSTNEDADEPGGYNFNKDFRNILGMDRFGARGIGAYTDKATMPSLTNSYYKEIHGYTYYAIKRIAASGQLLTYKGLTSGNDSFPTSTVNKLNDGQLTQYPYRIDDTFTVADTHSQYYQLNMEDPEIVVWYSLGTGSNGNALYDMSPKDASNNYYIYNKGNITYSGVGHSKVGDKDMEVKLFVNTMIAAYKAAIKAPSIEIINEEATQVNVNQYAFYLNSDSNEDTVYQAGDIIEIKFIPRDDNFLSQDLGVKAMLPDGTKLKIYNESGAEITSDFVNKKGEYYKKLVNGNTYIIRYDKSTFNSESLRQIDFTVENEKELKGSCSVQFIKRTLFDLD